MTEPSEHQSDIEPQGRLDPQTLWQSQKKAYDPMTLAQIHSQALSFERTVRKRNTIEYVTYAFTVGFTLALVLFMPRMTPVIRAGAALMALGMAFVAWQLHRRASPETAPPVGDSLVATYRRQLVRQRDAGLTGLWWYVLPIFPGPVVIMVGIWLKGAPAGQPATRLYIPMLVMAVVLAAAFCWMMFLIRAGVRRLQKMIDALD